MFQNPEVSFGIERNVHWIFEITVRRTFLTELLNEFPRRTELLNTVVGGGDPEVAGSVKRQASRQIQLFCTDARFTELTKIFAFSVELLYVAVRIGGHPEISF